jgi:hypothetical protein
VIVPFTATFSVERKSFFFVKTLCLLVVKYHAFSFKQNAKVRAPKMLTLADTLMSNPFAGQRSRAARFQRRLQLSQGKKTNCTVVTDWPRMLCTER